METRTSYTLVGAFVLVLLAGLFGFTVWIAKVQLKEGRDIYLTYFTGSVTGLQEGSPVRYRGIPIGTVTDIRLDPNRVSRVQVTVEVQPGTPIKTDSIASLELQGITGGAYVQINGGTENSPRLRDESKDEIPIIPSRPSTLAEVVDAAPQILNRALAITQRLEDMLSPENQQAITRTLANVQRLSDAVGGRSDEIGETISNLHAASRSLRQSADTLGPHVDEAVVQATRTLVSVDGAVKSFQSDMRGLSQAVREASGQLGAILGDNRRPMRDFAATGLYDLSLLISQLRDVSAQVSRVLTRVENDPTNFLFGGTRQGVEVRSK
ncbi:phospholipid/cholesterol/gamma-HCH transport system substrate-binding protein [Azospirillum fermentarium]|uniref:MlaD family protein n=1 Tax=Azospirillum fermentarium TaxID=1233114 RepID=UPI002226B865|nr:MlaD family protein [Azospirillum fermentarium]MCW2247987.1 phospholipid/cholesterol/gamma-HCH transport system substrate-binding protein [Azospirillum fermentarium]